jgi:hypothetical protein
VGDVFRITNVFTTYDGTTYDGPAIVFNGSGQSAVAIDAFLGGPGSTADNFIIDGDVSGQTKVKVNNTNTGPGVFNKEGIPVVFVNGATPNGNEFFLGNPIDTGFFNYDLFFRPTGSGVLELRSFLGQGAFVLPQLIIRTDSGYRFGSFNGGAFIEPLATIAVDWADIDGFSLGGNKVSFDDDANVRGRLGLSVGTSMQLWTGTTMEPFVIGSLWGNLSDDNQATLVSTGTTFILKDDLQDVWGEVSAGVNFFNPSANTSVFAKLDVTFGDDIDGVGGKAGMRVSW